jgi:hypothetical protein
MGEQFDKAKAQPERTGDTLAFPDSVAAELTRIPVEKVTEAGERFKKKTDGLLESAVANSALARYGLVTVEGLAYTVPGIVNGLYHNLSNLPELGFKAATAATIGIGLRLLLPEKGAARAVVGTTMGYFFVRDALHPFIKAYKDVSDARDVESVHKAAREMGDGLGLFAVDSYIGIKVGKFAEGMTGRALKSTLGTKDYLAFEQSKEVFWNSDKHVWGRGLNWVAGKADKVTGALAERLVQREQRQQIPLEEALRRVDEAGQKAQRSIEDGGFYKYGPRKQTGERVNFSEYVDALLRGDKPAEPTGAPEPVVALKPMFARKDTPGKAAASGADVDVVLSGTRPLEVRPPGGTPAAPSSPAEFDAANIAKLANHAQRVQKAWSDEAVQIADFRDGVKSPVISVSDKTRKGALLGPEYDASTRQLVDLANQVQNTKHVEEAGLVLDLHAKAALQHQMKEPAVMDLNMFAEELHGVFLQGLRKAGVSEGVLAGRVPSRVTVSNDGGAGNFTIPNIDGVIDRPVTLFPRNQTGLLSVFAGINRHEQLGHDHVYGDLARFPKEFREKLVSDAINNAMRDARIADIDINVPGLGMIKKSEFFKRMLIAQANENTADIVGTATGGPDTALSLGVLLQSLRKGGQLETRNVLGSRFEDFVEPHGFDRWRIKLAAETMRQLANGDKDVIRMADALDVYAAKASRPGSDYILASTDQPGQSVSIPMREWDAVIPHIVKAQLDTKLDALEGKTFRAILPELPPIVKKIDLLATQMADSVGAGSEKLTVPFDKTEFTIGQVFSAGLLGWLRSTARGEDPARALALINKISEGLRSEYRQGNPHVVAPAPPAVVHAVRGPAPVRIAADWTGRVIAKQTDLRNASARYATHMGSAATYLMMEDVLRHNRLKRELGMEMR